MSGMRKWSHTWGGKAPFFRVPASTLPPTTMSDKHTHRRHRQTRHNDGMRVGSAPVSWKSSPVPLWQLAWSSSHSSTGFPLGVVGPAVGAETRAKYYFSHFWRTILEAQLVGSAKTRAVNSMSSVEARDMFCFSLGKVNTSEFYRMNELLGSGVWFPTCCRNTQQIVVYINIFFLQISLVLLDICSWPWSQKPPW